MSEQIIDKRIYGGYEPSLEPLTGSNTPAVQGSTASAPVPLGDAAKGVPALAAGQAQLAQVQNTPVASAMEAMGAAFNQSSVAHVAEWFRAPQFEPAPNYNAAQEFSRVSFPLDLTQERFLLESRSPEEFAYKLDSMEQQNLAYQAMGDSPLGAIIGGIADPGYLGLSIATLGAGRAMQMMGASSKAARLTAGATTTVGAVGIGKIEQEVVPLSDTFVYANAMLFGAAETMLYRNGKLVKKDPDAPTPRLLELHNEVLNRDKPTPLGVEADDFVGPAPHYPWLPKSQGTARTPVTYGPGKTRAELAAEQGKQLDDLGGEYNPAVGLTREEQAAIHQDGVTTVRSVDDIAEHSVAVKLGATRIDKDAKAVYLPSEDRVFLIRDNLAPGDDVKGILLHEVGVHMNAERVLGTSRFGSMMRRLEEMAESGNARARQAFEDVPADTPPHLRMEEALGYYAERNHRIIGDHIIGAFVHGVREMLRKVGLKGLKLSENDIMQLVRKSAKAKRPGSFNVTFPYAWHGSPVKGIDKLDTAYMGSGEGNQAYGWGHYLSSEKSTGLDYRNKESVKRGLDPEQGGLYRIKINAAEHQFIDLDGRVQSATVQQAFDALGVRPGVTGKAAYAWLAKKMGSDKAASEALWELGVAGNKYATGRTRNSAVKNSNYVVFHNDAVDMAARYSKPLAAAAKAVQPKELGKALSWSLHKTLEQFGPQGKRIADLLVDNPLHMGGDSVASQQRAIRADLATHQFKFEDKVSKIMAERGFGTMKQIMQPTKAMAAQRAVEREVYLELMRRNALSQEGKAITHTGIPAHVKELADAWDETMSATLSELKRSGATGAAQIAEHAGYVSRKWDNVRIESAYAKMVAAGMTEAEAKQAMRDSLSIGLQRANGWDADLASDIAKAMLDRARRKGYFEDSAMRRHMGEDTIAEVRDYLTTAGVTGKRLERALAIMTGKADEAGKAPALKHRVQVALDEPIGQTGMQLVDVLDTSLVTIGERYLDNMSATAAFARKGMAKPSDIGVLRKEFLESIASETERATAAGLFDNTIAALRGDPVGEEMHQVMRMMRGLTQMVGLWRAGMFQLTEFATLMAEHGLVSVTREMFKELPFIRSALSDPAEAGHMRNVLAGHSSADIRMRPFIARTEDGFAIPPSGAAEMAIMQAKQLVPYLNGLKYVQGYQARVAANLAVNTFERAAKGEVKALAALEQYGLERHIMGQIQSDITAHGMNTAKWSDATWDAVRGPMTKMMDDAVLRARTGEIPAFAQFSTTGKFIFTFRSFVLGAHNKVLAGSLNRKGFAGLGLILMHQLPLMYMMAHASNTIAGKKELTEKQAFWQALGQAGALGLLSEAIGIASGEKQQFGAPGMIALDKMYKLGSSASNAAFGNGDVGQVGANAFNAVPLLSVIPVLKHIPESLNNPENK